MHTTINAATTLGITAHPVEVEVDLSYGMLQFNIVGLPDAAIKESRQRIATALKNCGIKLPERKITVNLAPADLKKEGTTFDLPIAIGILQAAEKIRLSPQFLAETLFLGELSLNGHIKPIKGALPISFDAHALKKKRLIVPAINAEEAALIEENEVIGVQTLTELISFLGGETTISPTSSPRLKTTTHMNGDIADVKGQKQAKRALQIAAAGHHNILFIGSPGAGKTMLAQRLPTIMPALRRAELLETSKIYSISGKMGRNALITQRPFRTPHHTISEAGLIGGGSIPQPGEISLAHNGILFLDELVEFKRSTLEILRQPLESGDVHIARAQQTTSYPASFILIAALNPCPCGYFGDPNRNCSCSPIQIKKYLTKLSGPLLDRIDLQIYLPPVSYDETQEETATSSAELSQTVTHAIDFQHKRSQTEWNAKLTATDIEKKCHLTPAAQACIEQLFKTCNLSMRGYHKIIKVASTIADLAQSELIEEQHIQEASMYRSLDQTLERMQQ